MKSRLLLIFLLVCCGLTVHAQMDMLPQIFRDLPPELQEGLPEEMSFAEYRQLNRNVDFFTMFMSMFIPGYGAFQVERPDLGWTIAGARAVGTAMMGVAVGLQWNHFYNLFQQPALDEVDFQRFLTNAFLFGGGVVINGLGWAADVTLAYHIAKNEKDLVQYTYGVRSSVARAMVGQPADIAEERYLRSLLVQTDDPRVRPSLAAGLESFTTRFPQSPFASEALYYRAVLHAEDGSDARALAVALRSMRVYPDGPRRHDCIRLMSQLVDRNRAEWGLDMASVTMLVEPGDYGNEDDERAYSVVSSLESIAGNNHVLRRAAIEQARGFLSLYPASELTPDALVSLARMLESDGAPEEAASYLAVAVIGWQESGLWPESAMRLADLYDGSLNDRARAEILYRAVIERLPGTEYAEEARQKVGQE